MKNLSIILAILVFSCNGLSDKTAEQIPPELKNKALTQGNRIATLAQQQLGSNLMKVINEKGPVYAMEFCNASAYPLLDSLNTGLAVKIKRASIRARNQADLPSDAEQAIIDQYYKNIETGKTLEPVAELLNATEVLYAAPIHTKNTMCLTCHGSEAVEIASETLATINSLYPEDNATGHTIGDLRGIWSIRFDRGKLESYTSNSTEVQDGLALIEQNCNVCHDPAVANHDAAIAPPLVAVKRRYLSQYPEKEEFTAGMISFLKKPTDEKALMNGPVRRFGVMPQFQWSDEHIESMVNYIYENTLDQPEWFEKHYEEMHGANGKAKH